MSNHLRDTVMAAPPAIVAGLNSFGITVPGAIQFFTLIYAAGLVVQQGYRFYRWLTAWLKARDSH